jgi:anti-anti-sigma factor
MEPSLPTSLRVGYINRLMTFPYWAVLGQGVVSRAAELGFELCLPHADAEDAVEVAVREVAAQRPDVAILPNSVVGDFPAALGLFGAARIPVVGVELEPNAQYACVLLADEEQGATEAIERLFAEMGGRGKVANLAGYPSARTKRQVAFHRLVAQHPGIELAYEGDGRWKRQDGAEVMRRALAEHPDLRGVFAHNDHMAVGAAEVIAELGLQDQIVVVGFDADPEGLAAIRAGRMAATVYRGLYGIGRAAVDTAARIVRGEQVPPVIRVPVRLITAENLVEATLDTTYLLPGLLHELITTNRARQRLQDEMISAQRSLIQELSTPVIPISDAILIVPLIGAIDSARAQRITEALLQAIARHGAQYMIVDITGIAIIDTAVAHHLLQAARSIRLLGAQVMLVGISPEVAQTLVGLGIDFEGLSTRATLQSGLEYAQAQLSRAGRGGR